VDFPPLPALPPLTVGPGLGPARAALARLNATGAGPARRRAQVVTGARPVVPPPALPDRPTVLADPEDEVVVLSDDLGETDDSANDE
jgi:hypothetical protein